MAHPNHPVEVLPGGETLTIDGSTVADPETGQPVPAAVLRLPAWRLRELSAALRLWSTVLTMASGEAHALPTETDLADRLATTATTLTATS